MILWLSQFQLNQDEESERMRNSTGSFSPNRSDKVIILLALCELSMLLLSPHLSPERVNKAYKQESAS